MPHILVEGDYFLQHIGISPATSRGDHECNYVVATTALSRHRFRSRTEKMMCNSTLLTPRKNKAVFRYLLCSTTRRTVSKKLFPKLRHQRRALASVARSSIYHLQPVIGTKGIVDILDHLRRLNGRGELDAGEAGGPRHHLGIDESTIALVADDLN